MTLRRRLLLLCAIGATLTLAAVLLSTFTFLHLVRERRSLVRRIDPATITTESLLTSYVDQETSVRGYVLSGNPLFLQPFEQGRTDSVTLTSMLDQSIGNDPRFRTLLADVKQSASIWESRAAMPASNATAANLQAFSSPARLATSKQLFDNLRSSFSALQDALARTRTNAMHTLEQRNRNLALALIGGLLVVIGAAVVVWWALRTWVLSPLRALASDVRDVTAGNLAHPIAAVGPPEMAEFSGHLEAMRKRIVGELETVTTARAELATLIEDLARSNVELEQFAYVASHDLQEPLRKVISFCQLLEERYRGQLDDRADRYIDFAVDGAKRMQVLINDLLAFSRVGRTTERFVPVELTACAEAAVSNLADRIRDAGADVRVGDLPSVQGDEALLTALFQNMIGNAVKFRSTDPPTVAVAARPTSSPDGSGPAPSAPNSSTHDMWLITVTDNGIGIEPRFANRIFVIFQRLHGREAYAGTGIGLAMCKKIVEFHGGRIWLDTEYVGGTRFAFTLPVASPGPSPDRSPSIPAPSATVPFA